MPIEKEVLLPIVIGLLLGAAATLYPPYNWGEEKLVSERDRRRYGERLPIKKHTFLMSDGYQNFSFWGWNYNTNASELQPMRLARKLIKEDLILEYVLILIISLGCYVILKFLR